MGKCIICGKETDNMIYAGSACRYVYVCEDCEKKLQKIWKEETKQ